MQKTIAGYLSSVDCVAFSPDGKTIANDSFRGNIYLWDVQTKRHKKTISGSTAWTNDLAFSPDGKTLASGSREGIHLWDLDTETPRI
ncbi:hypothetical protein F4167_02200 [Candidatus Poribacteria bacterium]|nr:hypothetical protein [Candidatus Poribacteria bacterium]